MGPTAFLLRRFSIALNKQGTDHAHWVCNRRWFFNQHSSIQQASTKDLLNSRHHGGHLRQNMTTIRSQEETDGAPWSTYAIKQPSEHDWMVKIAAPLKKQNQAKTQSAPKKSNFRVSILAREEHVCRKHIWHLLSLCSAESSLPSTPGTHRCQWSPRGRGPGDTNTHMPARKSWIKKEWFHKDGTSTVLTDRFFPIYLRWLLPDTSWD